MSFPPDAPESAFLRMPKVLKRWSFRATRKRLRQPSKMARADKLQRALVAPYHRAEPPRRPNPNGAGLAVHAIADFSGKYGLSKGARYDLERIRAQHPGLVVHDLGAKVELGVDVPMEDGPPIDMLYLLSAPDTYAQLFRRFPPERLRDTWRIGLWVWETPHFPAHWQFALPLVDEIWTPSEYSRTALVQAVGDIPITVKPHAVSAVPAANKAEARNRTNAMFDIPEGCFLGVSIIDIVACPARKNPWAHVAAWQSAFGDDPDAVLLMKIRVSKRTRIVLDELREMIGKAPNIRLLEAELSDEDITALQTSADVYLSLHRAEGYGLNIHECLALGTPVVATDFSANAEYGPHFDRYHPVPYRMVPYRDWTGHYADRDFEWAEADIDDAAKILKSLSKNEPDSLNTQGA